MLTLSGRTCVFAGATGRIGRGAVRALAEGGMNVVMVTHNPAGAQEIIDELKGLPGRVTAMSNENGDGAVFGDVEKEFGCVDVVINTIGAINAPVPLAELSEEKLNDKLIHQVTAPFSMMQAAVPFLKKSKAPRILFATTAASVDGALYENMIDSISRGGVVTMTKCFARELAAEGITVNCIARGGVVNDHDPREAKDYDVASVAGRIPVGHVGSPEEFGALVTYIASEEAGFVTGQIFSFSGGLLI